MVADDTVPVDAPEVHAPARHDLQHFTTMASFYDVLNVEVTASAGAIKKAFRALALVSHPDKGGEPQTFAFLQMVFEVLADAKKRRQYDVDGKDAFMDGWRAPAPPPDPVVYILHLEPIDICHKDVLDVINRKGAGLLRVASDRWSSEKVDIGGLRGLWMMLKQRADGHSNIPVIWHRDKLHARIGLPGRWYSGVHTLDGIALPAEVLARFAPGMDTFHNTVSVFDLVPRLFKELFRLGMPVLDPDQPKSFPNAMIHRHGWSIHLRRWCEVGLRNYIVVLRCRPP